MKATPLHLAARSGKLEAVLALLEAGSNVNENALHGATPLTLAVQNGHFEVAKALVQHGADVDLKPDEKGRTPVSEAENIGRKDILEYLLKKLGKEEHSEME